MTNAFYRGRTTWKGWYYQTTHPDNLIDPNNPYNPGGTYSRVKGKRGSWMAEDPWGRQKRGFKTIREAFDWARAQSPEDEQSGKALV